MKNCPSCGHEVEDAAAECANCGVIFAKWEAAHAQEPTTQEMTPTAPTEPTLDAGAVGGTVEDEPPSRVKRFAPLAALGAALLTFGVYYVLQLHPDPEEEAALALTEASDAVFPIVIGGKHGFVDVHGVVQIPARYDDARALSEGLAAVAKNGKWGYLDKVGHLVIALQYAGVTDVHEGRAFYSLNGTLWGVLDATGARVTAPLFEFAGDDPPFFSDSLAAVKQDGKAVYIDRSGHVAFGPYEAAFPFHDGLAAFSAGAGQYGFVDNTGRVVIAPAERSRPPVFAEGLAAIENNGLWGYINRTSAVAIPFSFKEAGEFHEGLAPVLKADKWGAIDAQGRLLFTLDPSVVLLHSFSQGRAIFETQDRKGYVDRTGRVIVKAAYDEAHDYADGLALVSRRRPPWLGYLNTLGRPVWSTTTPAAPPDAKP